MSIILISHAVTIITAGAFGFLILFMYPPFERLFGWHTPARAILGSMYLALMLVSLFALLVPEYLISTSFIIFPFQIIYGLFSFFTIRPKQNPLTWINLLLVFLYLASMLVLLSVPVIS